MGIKFRWIFKRSCFFFFSILPSFNLNFLTLSIPKQIYKIKSMLQGLDCFGHKIKRGWHGIYHFTENFIPVSVYPYILPDCSESIEWSVLELIYCFDVNFVYLLLLFFSCYEWWWNTRDGQKDYYYLVTLHDGSPNTMYRNCPPDISRCLQQHLNMIR